MPARRAHQSLDLHIRFATRADATRLAELSRTTIEVSMPTWRWTPGNIAHLIARKDTNVIVAEHAGDFVGFGAMAYGENSAHLILLAVTPHFQRRGVGERILGWLERVAREMDAQTIRVEALADNAAGRAFYEKQGFELRAAGAQMYEGRGGVRLEKRLTTAES
jgi:[ribosomal protein S18]-alanine N-acetyltransferase